MRPTIPSSKSARRPHVLALCAVVALVSSGVGLELARRARSSTERTPPVAALTTATHPARGPHGQGASRPGTAAASPTNEAPLPGSIDAASAPFDVGAVIDQVHFAFRPAPGTQALEGGHSTYSSRVDATGLTVVARPASGTSTRAEPLQLSVEGIARGSNELAGTPSDARVAPDGHAVLMRGAASEMYHNRDEGVEQSWGFDREPTGEGDLVVRVRASGLAYAGETSSGLHFADPSTGLGFRYGHGTWVDANGVETSVQARYASAAIELVVPADVVARSAYPAVLDPMISPEIGMDDPVLSRAPDAQWSPRVASNGTDYLVVWVESLSDENRNVHGARVTSAGVVSDAQGLDIAVSESEEGSPDVTSDGADYFVVWGDSGAGDIYGTRVTAAGVVSDTPGIAISTAAEYQYDPRVAWNGTEYLVVWTDQRSGAGGDIYGARVSADGTASDASGFPISTDSNEQNQPSVASDGTDWFVVWSDSRLGTPVIYGTPVTSAGVVALGSGIAISTGSYGESPTVASNGTDYLVAWYEFTGDSNYDVFGARVSAAGVLVDASSLAISTQAEVNESMPSVTSVGADYLVVWQDDRNGPLRDIYGARVTSSGTVSDASGIALSTAGIHQYAPSVTSNGTSYFAVWTDERSGGSESDGDIYGTRVASTGSVADTAGILLSTGTNQQFGPSVASNGTDYLVAWEDARDATGSDIYAVRVSGAGVVLDASGISVSTATDVQSNPQVASNGVDYLVVWKDRRSGTLDEVYAARVTALGEVSDDTGIALQTGASIYATPSVASNGTDYLVVWSDDRSNTAVTVYGTRVTSAGAVSDASGFVISMGTNFGYEPSVASNGTDYLVVWEDQRNFENTRSDVYGTRVTSAGVVQDTAGIEISAAANDQRVARVGSNGTDYFVVWQDYRMSSDSDVYGARLTSEGVVSDVAGVAVSTATNTQWDVRVAGSGSGYLVVWQDYRSGEESDIYGTRVLSGVAETAAGIVFAGESDSSEQTPWIAQGPGLDSLLVYGRYVPESPFGAERARARLIEFGEVGGACGTAADCTNGFCADGVCCNVACDGGGAADCLACSVAAGAAVDGTCGTVVVVGTVCRASVGTCDVADTCDGTATTCGDLTVAGGTPCSDGLACNGDETCNSGVCTSAAAPTCADSDVCTADSCADPSGCSNTPIPNCCHTATDCDDSDACTDDLCTANACAHTPVASCAMADAGMDDSGVDDAGTSDAGMSDSGPQPRTDGGPGVTPGGGGCATVASSSGALPFGGFIAFAALGMGRRVRRRRGNM